VKAKFIIEAANHPTDPEADEVEPSILCNNQEDNQFGNFFFSWASGSCICCRFLPRRE